MRSGRCISQWSHVRQPLLPPGSEICPLTAWPFHCLEAMTPLWLPAQPSPTSILYHTCCVPPTHIFTKRPLIKLSSNCYFVLQLLIMGGERRESVYLKTWAPDPPTSLPDMCAQSPTAPSLLPPLCCCLQAPTPGGHVQICQPDEPGALVPWREGCLMRNRVAP